MNLFGWFKKKEVVVIDDIDFEFDFPDESDDDSFQTQQQTSDGFIYDMDDLQAQQEEINRQMTEVLLQMNTVMASMLQDQINQEKPE
jgi:hypothetical protein